LNVHALYDLAFRRFRPARLRLLYRTAGLTAETRVLDVGGSADLWRRARSEGLPLPRLTVVNLGVAPDPSLPGVRWVCGDACRLPFGDLAFDVAVSNSVIEHVGGWESQVQFAAEIRRVARRYFVQTPDPRFPVEPHLLTPFVHWLPRRWQPRLARRCTVWGWVARPGRDECERFLRRLRLLSPVEMRRLFPESRLLAERVFGWPKSMIAAGPAAR
jgi:hypothetical protein